MIGPTLYLWMLAQSQPRTVSTGMLMSLKPAPVAAVTLTPDGDDWLVGAMSRSWSGAGKVDCEGPRTVSVLREGHPTLKIILECPEEKP